MSLTLNVDGGRWRAHLRAMAEANPGLVPVARVQLLIGTSAVVSSLVMASLISRRGCFLESVLSNPQVKLRARQPKSPCSFRFISTALLQHLRNRRAFDDAQIRGVLARPPGA